MPDQHFTPENLTAWGSFAAAVLAALLVVGRKVKGWIGPVVSVAQALLQLKAGHDSLTARSTDHEARLRTLESQVVPLIERDQQRDEDVTAMRQEIRKLTEAVNQAAIQINTVSVQQSVGYQQQDQVLRQLNTLTEALITRKDHP